MPLAYVTADYIVEFESLRMVTMNYSTPYLAM